MTIATHPRAGMHFPIKQLDGLYMRLDKFMALATLDGDTVGCKFIGAYGLAVVEVSNTDVEPDERLVTLPFEHVSDYKSVHRAYQSRGIKSREEELILFYEHRTGLFGSRKPSIHVGAFLQGTWIAYMEYVARYEAKKFAWPDALFHYQPTSLPAFNGPNNIFRP